MSDVQKSIPVLTTDASQNDLGSALDEAGCCVIEAAAAPDVMDSIRMELAPFAEEGAFGVGEFEGLKTRRTGAVILRSPTYRSIARHPTLLAAGEYLFSDATAWGLSSTELIEIFPGQGGQAIHRDQWKYDYVDLPIEAEINAMWAVTDFTEENGATRIMPGSHRLGNDLRPEISETIPADMSKGSLLLYLGKTYHGGGQNKTDEIRVGLSLQHSVSWVARGELFFLECTPSVVADWDDELVRFLGYQMGGDSLGVFMDSLDPMAAVHPDREYEPGWAKSNKLEKQ
ncbi:MAG: phytanoyl-CoA dioxygenase family protein [Acidimicrobiia bacterium]|nr:phytanoyl-CoA dioxygenase family protein [Acidimicrobiia bacterium]